MKGCLHHFFFTFCLPRQCHSPVSIYIGEALLTCFSIAQFNLFINSFMDKWIKERGLILRDAGAHEQYDITAFSFYFFPRNKTTSSSCCSAWGSQTRELGSLSQWKHQAEHLGAVSTWGWAAVSHIAAHPAGEKTFFTASMGVSGAQCIMVTINKPAVAKSYQSALSEIM